MKNTNLYVGFKGKYNSSFVLVNRFCGNKLFLTNSFSGLKKDIDNIKSDYSQIIMFGLDKNLSDKIRIERVAKKDNIVYETKINTNEIKNSLQSTGVNAVISNKTTHYLCNEAYFYMLKKFNGNVVFIHIPPLRFLTKEISDSILNIFNTYNGIYSSQRKL